MNAFGRRSNMLGFAMTSVSLDPLTGALDGTGVKESRRTIAGLAGYFRDESARAAMDQNRLAYRVQAYEPRPEGERGAVCCATTFLEPGIVGDEYFLTRGHFHANEDCPELEVTVSGTGLLVLMTSDRRTWTEPMRAGSVHHVPPGTAHRVANIGDEPLVFVSYWPSETGHDYRTIVEGGFGARVRRIDGTPTLVPDEA
jgi:glucose-6-phosphate isomerase